jgi:ketosteroid isomerase-like protein
VSHDNLALIRANFARFQAGDPGWIEFVDPDIEWDFTAYPLADIPARGRGREAVIAEVIDVYYSGWVDYQAEITELVDAGEDTVVIQHETVHMRGTKTALERDIFHVWTIRDRKWTLWRNYPTREAALEAVGLRS